MKGSKNITLKNVWNTSDETFRQEVKNFWKKEGVITNLTTLEERAGQVILAAYNPEGKIVGVSTALKMKVKLLNENWLYQYRCFISPTFRAAGFDVHLTLESLKVLEAASRSDAEPAIGVFVVVENQNLMKNKYNNAAVWRAYKMYFIGFNSKGQPIRVYYFKGAKV